MIEVYAFGGLILIMLAVMVVVGFHLWWTERH